MGYGEEGNQCFHVLKHLCTNSSTHMICAHTPAVGMKGGTRGRGIRQDGNSLDAVHKGCALIHIDVF